MTRGLKLSQRAAAIEPTLIRSLRAQMGPDTIDFGLGQTDLPITEAVGHRVRQLLAADGRAPYTPNAGLPEARRAVADHAGVLPAQVMLTCGVQEALAVAIFGLCEPGDEVLVPDPGFPAYANLVRAAGAKAVPYALAPPHWELVPEAIVDKIGSPTKLVILNNPSNPTGGVSSRQALQAVMEALAARDVGWISDEIYEDYVWDGEFVSAMDVAAGAPGLVLSGLSKSHHMMGWRLGWMIGEANLIDELTPLHQHLVTCAPRPAQEAAMAALAVHDEAMAATRQVLAARREQVLSALKELPLGSPPRSDGAFYMFVDVRPWLTTFESTLAMAQQLLAEEDVMVIPGEGFGASGLGHLRLAYTIGGDALSEGLQRLCRFLSRHDHRRRGD